MERKYPTNKNLKGITEKPRKPWRSITLEDNTVWGWQIRGASVLFLLPTGKKIIPMPTHVFLGMYPDDLRDAIWEGYAPQIEPSRVRMWIVSGFSVQPLDDSLLKLIDDIYLKKHS